MKPLRTAMVFVTCCTVLAAEPQKRTASKNPVTKRVELELALRERLVGKVATLRHFYKAAEQRFDTRGELIGESKTGPWTYFGRIEVQSIKLHSDSLVITGERNVSQWEGTEFRNTTLRKPMRIVLELERGYTEASLTAEVEKVFLLRSEKLSDLTPEYWKDLLVTERHRREEWDQQKAQLQRTVLTANAQTTPPKLLSKAEGVEVSAAPFANPADNQLLIWFVVDASGGVGELQIQRPIGLGVDDPIAEMIKGWKFEPAMRTSQPVAMMMYAKFVYVPKKPGGSIDPYHTQPCPGIQNVYQC